MLIPTRSLRSSRSPHSKHSHARVSSHARPFSFPGGPNRINGSQSLLACLLRRPTFQKRQTKNKLTTLHYHQHCKTKKLSDHTIMEKR